MIDRASPLPLYHQLRGALETRIRCGEWPAGTRTPSERRLCAQFGVSLITVRRALEQLVADGRLRRLQGRGTYVARPLDENALSVLELGEDLLASNSRVETRVVALRVSPASQSLAETLDLVAGEQAMTIKRLRFIHGEAVALEVAQIPERLASAIAGEPLERRSLRALLREKCGIRTGRAVHRWQAVTCAAPEAQFLGRPALRVQRTTFDQQQRPFEYLEAFFRGDLHVLRAEVFGAGPEAGTQAAPDVDR